MMRSLLRRLGDLYVTSGRWSRRLAALIFGANAGSSPRRRFCLRLEVLEERAVPSATFASQQTFNTGASPEAVVMADINGDGKLDLVSANSNSSPGTVSVLLNTTA
jgi:hypothetical protein